MNEFLSPLLFIVLIALFWELTAHNIWRVLTPKHHPRKSLTISFIGFVCVIAVVSLITLTYYFLSGLILPFAESSVRITIDIFVMILIVAGIYITSRLIFKETRSTVIFVTSFFSLVGVVICDLTLNYVKIIIPEYRETAIFFLTLGAIIILIGVVIAFITIKWIAPAMKELIEKLSGQLNEFIWVSVIGVITYLPMIVYFNAVDANDSINTQFISRFIFLILYISIYLIIIFGVRRSMKNLKVGDELRLAKEIQNQILPSQNALNEIPGVKIAAMMKPYAEIGGDFYDAFKIDEEKSAFIIADVVGKGIGAALFMMQVKSLLKVNLRMDKMSDYVLTAANIDQLKKKNKVSMYYGAVVSIFETKTRRYTYSCGGHIPPLLIRKGSVSELLYCNDPEIGICDTIYSEFDITLEKDDIIFLYTDGIIDTKSADGKLYSKERLTEVISKETEPDKIISALTDDLNNFRGNAEQEDDLTVLVFKVL